MYLYWSYLQDKNYASANNILKIMNFKIYILHFLAHIHAKDTNPTLICHCVYDDILQVPLVSTHFIFSCQLPNELRSPWTYFSKCFANLAIWYMSVCDG